MEMSMAREKNPRSTKTESSMSSLRECRSTRVRENKRNIVVCIYMFLNIHKMSMQVIMFLLIDSCLYDFG